jgi:flagellar basal body-associated protein FliL
MVVMWVALIAVVVVVAGAVVAKLTWRPSNDEVHSVKDYHSALGTIGDLSRRNPPPGTGGSDRSSERGPYPGNSETPLVFDDDRTTGPTPRVSSTDAGPIFRSDRARRQALSSMNHRPRRWVLTTGVVVVLAAFGALAYVGSHRNTNHPAKKSSAVSPTTAAVRTSHPSTTTPTTKPKSKPKPKPPTPTTVPTQIVALQTTDTTASYPAPASSYQVNVTASTQPCWIQATSAATGATLWAGTIQTGDSQIIQATGTMVLDMGALGSVVTLNGVPVVLPTPLTVPFYATFTAGASATTPTTAPASTTATTG